MAKKTLPRHKGDVLEIKEENEITQVKEVKKQKAKKTTVAVEEPLLKAIRVNLVLEEQDTGTKTYVKDWIAKTLSSAVKKELSEKDKTLVKALGIDINLI